VIRPLILCNSSLTPGRLKPAFKPLGCLNTGFCSPPVVVGGMFGFFWLIRASAFNY
jgi:hypothetical protein